MSNISLVNEEIRVIRNLFDPSNQLNDEQIQLFLHVSKERKLDPRLKQICAIPKFNKNTRRTECVIITQIDGFRLIAERTGNYAPGRPTEFMYDNNGKLIGATSYVKKRTEDNTWHEVGETAFMSEYDAGTFPWKKMAHVMLAKCAEARALRRAFPGDLSGLYTNDEMDQAINDTVEVVDPVISHDKVSEIKSFIGEDNQTMNQLLKLCKVERIEDIKECQLEACRNFAKAQISRRKQIA